MISAKLGFEMKNSHPNVSFLTAFKLYLKVKIAMWETKSRATKNMNTILHNILFISFFLIKVKRSWRWPQTHFVSEAGFEISIFWLSVSQALVFHVPMLSGGNDFHEFQNREKQVQVTFRH